MVIVGIPREEIRHTKTVQEWLAEGCLDGGQWRSHDLTPHLKASTPQPRCSTTTTPHVVSPTPKFLSVT